MTEFDRTNTWSLFKNERKEDSRHADYQGTINVNGVEFWLNGWLKTSAKDGKKFFSGNIKPKEVRQDAPRRRIPEPMDDDLDGVPF